MAAIEIQPLGWRGGLVGFAVRRAAGVPLLTTGDVRQQITLWDARGRPHVPYPEVALNRALSGTDLLALQTTLWSQHATTVRDQFGGSPLVGSAGVERPWRGLLAFPLAVHPASLGAGRWTLTLRDGPLWYFTTAQLVAGVAHGLAPSREQRTSK